MKNYLLTLPAIALLAACGGSGGGDPTTEPTQEQVNDNDTLENIIGGGGGDTGNGSDSGGDTSGGDTSGGDTSGGGDPEPPTDGGIPFGSYGLDDLNLVVTQRGPVADRAPGTGSDSYSLVVNNDGTAVLTQGGRSVEMTLGTDLIYFGETGQGSAENEFGGFLDQNFTAGDVTTALLIARDFTSRTEGFVVIGTPTDPAIANALTNPAGGTAEYRGLMNARIVGPDPSNTQTGLIALNGLGGGGITFDFDQDKASGSFSIFDPRGKFDEKSLDSQFPRMTVTLNEGTVANGEFGGTATLTFVDDGGLGNPDLASNGDAVYGGDFFGNAGLSAGGTVVGTLDNDGDDFVFQGAFAVDDNID